MRKLALIFLLVFLFPAFSIASTYGSNFFTGGVSSGSQTLCPTADAFDNNTATSWCTGNVAFDHWLQYDLGTSTTKALSKMSIMPYADGSGSTLKDFWVIGSNDGTNWFTVQATTTAANTTSNNVWQDYYLPTSTPATAYRFYRAVFSSTWYSGTNNTVIYEWQAFECTDCVATSTTMEASQILSEYAITILEMLIFAAGFLIAFKFIRRKK